VLYDTADDEMAAEKRYEQEVLAKYRAGELTGP
jgi:hypothetical protein